MAVFAIGLPSPVSMPVEGPRIITAVPPITIGVSLISPTLDEIAAFRYGKIVHGLGTNDDTAWMSMIFHDVTGEENFAGSVFYNAAKEPGYFTDDRIAELRTMLKPGIGLSCLIFIVDTNSQLIVSLRNYSWSNKMSLAFVDSVERTRHSSPLAGDRAADELDKLSVKELAERATVRFTVPGMSP